MAFLASKKELLDTPKLNNIMALPTSSNCSDVAAVWCSDGSEEEELCSSASSIVADCSSISSTSSVSSKSRQVSISYRSIRLSIPTKGSIRRSLLKLRDDFLAELRVESFPELEEEDDATAAKVILLEHFIRYVLRQKISDVDRLTATVEQVHHDILDTLLRTFAEEVGSEDDIHAVTFSLPVSTEVKKQILSTFIHASHLLGRYIPHYEIASPNSALFQAAHASQAIVYAIFGGQGTDNYFDSLIELHARYEPLISPLLLRANAHLQRLISAEQAYQPHFPKSLDIMSWLRYPETRPTAVYLASAPVSFPLIGLLQLAAFETVARLQCLSPSGMHSMLSGATGHSQGIITAAVISASTDWTSFHSLAMQALSLLLSIGCRSQSVFTAPPARHAIINDALDHGEGTPSAMLSVRQISLATVQKIVASVNAHLPSSAAIEIALHNGRTNFVLAGPAASLHGFNVHLRGIKTAAGQEQSRISFDKRKPAVSNRFLPISAPFHSSHLADAAALVLQDIQTHDGLHIRGCDLGIPVYSTTIDGSDMRLSGSEDIVPKMVRMITEETLHWTAATKLPDATHLIDFGPGRAGAGAGGLVHSFKDGSGVRVLNALEFHGEATSPSFGGISDILTRGDVSYGTDWSLENSPSLLRTTNKHLVSTKMSRLLGLPPVMVAGMTPTTCDPSFVAAIANAGFHVEFATGGYHDAASLETALRKVAASIPAGRGIACNLIYANPTALRWQIALLRGLSSEGVIPIEGLTFGAGVPSLDIASEYISTFPGLKHIGFKPGSRDAIRQVVAIAKANESFPVVLQWTGGRAGGHHSFEDFHEPILQAYAEIRSQQNIILVAGSGFGDVDGSYPYLTGEWTKRFDLPAMPFDGILLGSRVMTAAEAKTSRAAKQAIVNASGVEDTQWTGTYKKPTGDVLTVISEMGEPIHMLATRGVRLWADMDRDIFSVTDKVERLKRLRDRKSSIIQRLNDDFQKPWFGRSGENVVELEEMTYTEVVERMIQLLYIRHESRWVHPSLQQLVLDFILRAESRFVVNNGSLITTLTDLSTTPEKCFQRLVTHYPAMAQDIISYQDAQHFLSLCRRRGQKPVPFVPALDDHFETWFKKDSLWQSEDLAAVIGQDVGRVCILQGPVAAKHARMVDEPVKDILVGIHDGFVRNLLEAKYGGDEMKVPFLESFGLLANASTAFASESALEKKLRALAGGEHDWRHAFFTCKTIVQDGKVVANPIRRLLDSDSSVQAVDCPSGNAILLNQVDTNDQSIKKVVEIRSSQTNIIDLCFFEDRTATKKRAELVFKYEYRPECSFAPIHEIMEGREERIRSFYRQIWFGDEQDNEPAREFSIRSEFHSGPVHVTAQDIRQLATTLQNLDSIYPDPQDDIDGLIAPMDFAIVAAWKPLVQPLFASDVQGDLLKLVHLSNGYRMVPGARPVTEGDIVETTARVTAVLNQPSGKMIEVRGQISRAGVPVMDIESRFLFRGTYHDHENTFQITKEEPVQIHLDSASDVAVLKSKPWLRVDESALRLIQPKSILVFHLQTENRVSGEKGIFDQVKTTGWVEVKLASNLSTRLGSVEHTATKARANSVLSYLHRKGKPVRPRVMFEAPRPLFEDGDDMIIEMPSSNELYATVSGDYNPIHVSKTIASYAALPGTITHGMYASGRVRAVIEQLLHSSTASFFKAFHCSFVGMMLPGEKLQISLHHVGMISGTRIVKVDVTKIESGETVLRGEAEVDPPKTAYVFTGQGSQKVGMGMELYNTSEVAKEVWDRADKHFLDTYGELYTQRGGSVFFLLISIPNSLRPTRP